MKIKKFVLAPAVFALVALFGANVALAAGPALSVGMTPVIVTQNGTAATPNVTFATLRLSATSSTEDILVSAIPMTVTAGNGGSTSNLSNCRVVNLSNGSVLNTGSNVSSFINNGSNSITLDTPLRIAAGTMVDVAIRCNIIASNAINNTYSVSVSPFSVVARSASTNTGFTPTAGEGVPTPPIMVTTTGTIGTTIPVIIPGLPNTGMGGNASTNVALLALAGLVTAAGFAYTRRFAR
ncbi:MAG: hypothetical protein JWL80_73 [Parcubacteria group bacterium]|nr:hypothetical protein [Parcubacteria group bacterium]